MSFSVNTNAGSLTALQNLNATTQSLETTQTRINTGLSVSSTKDDAASFAIAQTLRSDIAGFNAVNQSLDRAQSELDVAIAGAEAISDLLIQAREKAVAAKDISLDADSRNSLDNDYQQLLSQIDTIANNAVFNGKNLLTGDSLSAITSADGDSTITASTSTLTTAALSLDATTIASSTSIPNTAVATGSGNLINSGEALNALNNYMDENHSTISAAEPNYDHDDGGFFFSFDIAEVVNSLQANFGVSIGTAADGDDFLYLHSGSLFIEGSGATAQFTTSANSSVGGDPAAAVAAVDTAIETVNSALSELGATANRVALQQNFSGKLSDTLEVGVGNLVDADLAKEAANLQSFQTRQQLGLQALAIANQGPQSVLSLFR